MITFPELREIFETYNPSAQFVIYSTKNRAVLGSAVGFEAAKDKARQIRQQKNLKFDEVSFMTSKRFYGGSTGEQGASGASPPLKGLVLGSVGTPGPSPTPMERDTPWSTPGPTTHQSEAGSGGIPTPKGITTILTDRSFF